MNIEMPEYLLQFLVHPIFAAMEPVSGRLTAGDSAELDMYLEVLDRIFKAYPDQDQKEWYNQWCQIK